MSAMEMSTAYKQKGHLIISVDYSLMDSDGENYHMFNEPKGMFLLIQTMSLPTLQHLSLCPCTELVLSYIQRRYFANKSPSSQSYGL